MGSLLKGASEPDENELISFCLLMTKNAKNLQLRDIVGDDQ